MVGDVREADDGVLRLVDVLDPLQMRLHRVHRPGDDLDAALCDPALEFGGQAQSDRAWRGEGRRVGEEDAPAVTEPLVKADAAFTGILFEIGGFFFSSRRRHTRSLRDWSSDVCSSD